MAETPPVFFTATARGQCSHADNTSRHSAPRSASPRPSRTPRGRRPAREYPGGRTGRTRATAPGSPHAAFSKRSVAVAPAPRQGQALDFSPGETRVHALRHGVRRRPNPDRRARGKTGVPVSGHRLPGQPAPLRRARKPPARRENMVGLDAPPVRDYTGGCGRGARLKTARPARGVFPQAAFLASNPGLSAAV